MLILPETAPNDAGVLAEKLRGAFADLCCDPPAPTSFPIRASFGIAAYPDDGPGANELIAAADARLYSSKRRGGDAVTCGGDREVERIAAVG